MQGAVYYLFVEIVDRHARNVTVRHAHVRFKVTHRYALDTSHLLSGWLNDLASLFKHKTHIPHIIGHIPLVERLVEGGRTRHPSFRGHAQICSLILESVQPAC